MKSRVIILVVTVCLFACRKEEHPKTLHVSVEQRGNGLFISWNNVQVSDFKRLVLYRSDEQIPDPAFGRPIAQKYELAGISDAAAGSFLDSTINFGKYASVNYKLVLYFKDRFIISNQVTFSLDAFSVSTAGDVTPFPQVNALYIYQFPSTIVLVDYTQKKITHQLSLPYAGVQFMFYPVINNGRPELFVLSGTTLYCLDALTLSQKYSMALPYTRQFVVRDDHLYLLSYTYSVKVFNLTTRLMVAEQAIPYRSGRMYADLMVGSAYPAVYVKYMNERYDPQQLRYFYVNELIAIDLLQGMPQQCRVVNIDALNPDSLQATNYANILLSPNGKYLSCNGNGDIYDISGGSLMHIALAPLRPRALHINVNGNYAIREGSTEQTQDVFSLAGLNYLGSYDNQHLMGPNGWGISGDFLDGDTLVSYQVNYSSMTSLAFKRIGL